MNYIFLDIDGVLNNEKHYKKQHKKYGGRFCCENMPFNARSIKNLRKIIDKTNSKIVLSSSWRRIEKCMTILKARLIEYGIKIYSVTPFIDGCRGKEILKWCKENLKENDKILIIDDNMYDIGNYYNSKEIVKIDGYKGLTVLKTLEAIKKIKMRKNKEDG